MKVVLLKFWSSGGVCVCVCVCVWSLWHVLKEIVLGCGPVKNCTVVIFSECVIFGNVHCDAHGWASHLHSGSEVVVFPPVIMNVSQQSIYSSFFACCFVPCVSSQFPTLPLFCRWQRSLGWWRQPKSISWATREQIRGWGSSECCGWFIGSAPASFALLEGSYYADLTKVPPIHFTVDLSALIMDQSLYVWQ